jgi:signal peptidase I
VSKTGSSDGPDRPAGVVPPVPTDGSQPEPAASAAPRGRGRTAAASGAAGDGRLERGETPAPPGRKRRKEKSGGKSNSPFEIILIVAVALGLALGIQAFLVKPYRIPSESMLPTLVVGQRVLVNRIGNRFGDPHVGDVTVFHPPSGAENANECGVQHDENQPCPAPTKAKAKVNFIKRIVAGPGDTLAIIDGHAIRNGKRQNEPFILPCGGGEECNFPKPITIPAGHYFMMGDNRGASDDSRYWGPVPRDWIIGNAFATYWPPKRIGLL